MSENQTNNHILYYKEYDGGWEYINDYHLIHEFSNNINETLEIPPPIISKPKHSNVTFAGVMESFYLRLN
jgi:hypothetical protein